MHPDKGVKKSGFGCVTRNTLNTKGERLSVGGKGLHPDEDTDKSGLVLWRKKIENKVRGAGQKKRSARGVRWWKILFGPRNIRFHTHKIIDSNKI